MDWKGCGRKQSWPNWRQYHGVCLEGLRKTTTNLNQDSQSPGRGLEPGPPKYEAGVITTRIWCSRTWSLKVHCVGILSSECRPVSDLTMIVSCDVAPWSLVEIYWGFRGSYCLHHLVPDDTTAQKTVIFILIAWRTWNITEIRFVTVGCEPIG
jgi:hypothetical protein